MSIKSIIVFIKSNILLIIVISLIVIKLSGWQGDFLFAKNKENYQTKFRWLA